MGKAGRFGAVAAAVVIIGAGSALLGASAAAETLKLGNEGVYPPFSMVDAKGELTGFEPISPARCTFTTLRKKYLSVPILAADQACAEKSG